MQINKKELKALKCSPDIITVACGMENEGKKKLSTAEFLKEETGLRCGGRGKSEISSAL
jgi:hypothetical protein